MTQQPFYLPDPQDFAFVQERQRHDQALYSFGEYTMFVMMWTVSDFEEGLVDRCSTCYSSYGKIAEAYGQPARTDCPNCFGTSLEGGFKAQIVRPAIWDFTEPDTQTNARGEVTLASATVQTTGDFSMNTGDYLFRADGTRWESRSNGTNHLHTGFEMLNSARSSVGYNYTQASLVDASSVAYLIPPSPVVIKSRLDIAGVRVPQPFGDLEVERAALE